MTSKKLSEVDLFFIRLKHGWVSKSKKQKLYNLVNFLENATSLQKTRFCIAYNLESNPNIKYNLSKIARQQGCSPIAIKYSIVRVRSFLVNLNDNRKNIFSEIIKDNDYFNKHLKSKIE